MIVDSGTHLSDTKLDGAYLSGKYLWYANFWDAELNGAIFDSASIFEEETRDALQEKGAIIRDSPM